MASVELDEPDEGCNDRLLRLLYVGEHAKSAAYRVEHNRYEVEKQQVGVRRRASIKRRMWRRRRERRM